MDLEPLLPPGDSTPAVRLRRLLTTLSEGQASRLSGTVQRLSSARRTLPPGRVSANSGQAGSLSYGRALWWTLLLGVLLGLSAHAAQPFEFTRLIAHWSE